MTFAFFATAAPASQPVPPPDASAPAAPGSTTADAFDAALAETLAVIDRHAARQTAGGGSGLPMAAEWIFPAFSAPVDSNAGIEQAAADIPSDADAPVEEPADAPIDLSALPADIAVVVPMSPAPVIASPDRAAAVAAAAAPAAGTADPSLDMAVVAPEATTRRDGPGGTRDAGPAAVTEEAAPAAAPRGTVAVEATAPAPGTAPVPADLAVLAESTETAALTPELPGPVAEPSAAAGGSERPLTPAAMSESRRAALRYITDAMQQMQPPDAAVPDSRVAPSAPLADLALAGGVPVPGPPTGDTPAAGPADRSEAEVVGVAQPELETGSGEGSDQGQGRPSPEFVRFAAALSQSGGTDFDDAARVTGTVALPAGQSAPAATATAAAAPVAPIAPATMTPGEENIGRLVQAMRVNARPGAWEATVHLNPEHLGDVTIALRVERNTVSAVVNAEAAGVRQWLETQEQAVRSGMAEHGLQLERFVVQRDGQRREAHQQNPPEQRRRQPNRATQGAERFEIHV